MNYNTVHKTRFSNEDLEAGCVFYTRIISYCLNYFLNILVFLYSNHDSDNINRKYVVIHKTFTF